MASKAQTKGQRKEEQRAAERLLQEQRSIAQRRRRQRDRIVKGIGILVAVTAVAAAVLYVQSSNAAVAVTPASADLGPPSSAVPASPTGNFTRIDRVIRRHGKTELFYVGEMYCPYCAAERWSVVKALSQFGTWSNLAATTNGKSVENFGIIPTFDFMRAGYHSRYIALDTKDITDWNGKPLESFSLDEQGLFNRYDPTGGTPMVLAGDHVMVGSGYSPSEIQGRSFGSVQRAMERGEDTSYTRAINAEANVITALLCRADGHQPAATCTRPVIKRLAAQIS